MLGNKEIMAKNIKYQMAKNNVNATDICNDLGFKHNTFSDWVNAKTYPRIDKIEMMANYFGISKALLVEESSLYYEMTEKSVERLKEAMHDNKMTSTELVEKTGIDKGYMTSYIKGTRQMNNSSSYMIAKELGVSPVWLIGFDVPKFDAQFDFANNNPVNKEALTLYAKYLNADNKTRKMIDMLLDGGDD